MPSACRCTSRRCRARATRSSSRRIAKKYSSDPGYYAAFGFVAGTVLEAAVKKAGSTDAEKVREVLTTLKLGTVMGKHEVDPTTYMQIGVRGLLVQVQNGKREVIWPEEYKTAEPKLPIPAWDKR